MAKSSSLQQSSDQKTISFKRKLNNSEDISPPAKVRKTSLGKHHVSNNLGDNQDFVIHKIELKKIKILSFFESILHVDLSDLVLTDITFKEEHGKLTVVGRPKVDGSATKQMRHVIPYSFVEHLIQSEINISTCPQEALKLLSKTILVFAKAQKGYAVSANDLETKPYNDILELPKIANRSISNNGNTVFLASPIKGGALKWTPVKRAKAETDFSIFNIKFIQQALDKFNHALESSDEYILNIASEALSRFIFIIFNKSKYAVFAKEGNTVSYELRLYKSEDSAFKAGKDYEVMTARELQSMNHDTINKCIRIVDCEGSKIRDIPKALKIINDIIFKYNMLLECDSASIATYNSKYNYQLKLSNADITIPEYNQELMEATYLTQLPYQLAKILYSIFDLKALEQVIVTPNRKEGDLTFYTSASGQLMSQYKFDDGNEIRADEREGARGYSSEEVFRNNKTDLSILARKLSELFVIATTPFASMQKGFINLTNNFISLSLNKLAELASYDYQMNSTDSQKLKNEVFEIFDILTNNTDDYYTINDLSILGVIRQSYWAS